MTACNATTLARVLVILGALAGCGDTYFVGDLPPDASDASNDVSPGFGCDGCAPPPPYDPCAGKACGDGCLPCPNGDPKCGGLIADTFFCDRNGACTTRSSVCAGGPGYDPCAGKTCGASCTLCAPDDMTCHESGIAKTCGGDAGCSVCKGPQP
jgi:hypothetical protein